MPRMTPAEAKSQYASMSPEMQAEVTRLSREGKSPRDAVRLVLADKAGDVERTRAESDEDLRERSTGERVTSGVLGAADKLLDPTTMAVGNPVLAAHLAGARAIGSFDEAVEGAEELDPEAFGAGQLAAHAPDLIGVGGAAKAVMAAPRAMKALPGAAKDALSALKSKLGSGTEALKEAGRGALEGSVSGGIGGAIGGAIKRGGKSLLGGKAAPEPMPTPNAYPMSDEVQKQINAMSAPSAKPAAVPPPPARAPTPDEASVVDQIKAMRSGEPPKNWVTTPESRAAGDKIPSVGKPDPLGPRMGGNPNDIQAQIAAEDAKRLADETGDIFDDLASSSEKVMPPWKGPSDLTPPVANPPSLGLNPRQELGNVLARDGGEVGDQLAAARKGNFAGESAPGPQLKPPVADVQAPMSVGDEAASALKQAREQFARDTPQQRIKALSRWKNNRTFGKNTDHVIEVLKSEMGL